MLMKSENIKFNNDSEIYLKVDFQISKLFSKMIKINSNTQLQQIEKNILSKFKIDSKVKEKMSILKIHGLDPKAEERQKSVGSFNNLKISIVLDEILNLMLDDDYTHSFSNKTKVEETAQNICEIPYSNLIFQEKPIQTSYCIEKKCIYQEKSLVLKDPYEKNLQSKSFILNEINIMSNLNHPNIPKFFGKVYNPYTYYYGVLEKNINGQSLESLILRKDQIKDGEKWLLLLKILEVIDYIHKMNICINNLNPRNIIVKNKGKLYLTDFSQATFLNPKNNANSAANFGKTKGFNSYSAPETIYKSNFERSMDIWSFGTIAYFIFSGKNPWLNNYFDASEDIFNQQLFDTNDISDSVARNLIQMCCNYDPSLRPTADFLKVNITFHLSNYRSENIFDSKYFTCEKNKFDGNQNMGVKPVIGNDIYKKKTDNEKEKKMSSNKSVNRDKRTSSKEKTSSQKDIYDPRRIKK